MNDSSLRHNPNLVRGSSSSANGGRAARPTVDHIERPAHMRLAEAWYRAYAVKTVHLISPGPDEYMKAEKVCARMDWKVAEKSIGPYFNQDWWFTKDKKTGRYTYSFGSWVSHIEEILAAAPEKPKAKGWTCPKGHLNTNTGSMCLECGADRFEEAR